MYIRCGLKNRDPFGLKKDSALFRLLRNSASTAAENTAEYTHQAAEYARDIADSGRNTFQQATEPTQGNSMSYALPQTGPTHRQQHGDNRASSGRSRFPGDGDSNGSLAEKVSDRVSGMFGGDKSQLPMYKDKPTSYLGSHRRLPWFRRKRVMGLVLGCLAGLSWWFGILSPLSYFSAGGATETTVSKGSSWFGKGATADWEARAEQVKDVFKTSWAGYEKHAMGTLVST